MPDYSRAALVPEPPTPHTRQRQQQIALNMPPALLRHVDAMRRTHTPPLSRAAFVAAAITRWIGEPPPLPHLLVVGSLADLSRVRQQHPGAYVHHITQAAQLVSYDPDTWTVVYMPSSGLRELDAIVRAAAEAGFTAAAPLDSDCPPRATPG